MSIDTYGLSAEQYEEFFEDNIKFSAKLFQRAYSIMNDAGLGYLDLKTCLDLYQEEHHLDRYLEELGTLL